MQSYGRLVKHIENAGQPRPDLRGEAYALAFPAGKRARIARKRQIFKTDIVQKFQPFSNFLQNTSGYLFLLVGKLFFEVVKPLLGGANGLLHHLADMKSPKFDGQRLRFQAISATSLAIGN